MVYLVNNLLLAFASAVLAHPNGDSSDQVKAFVIVVCT